MKSIVAVAVIAASLAAAQFDNLPQCAVSQHNPNLIRQQITRFSYSAVRSAQPNCYIALLLYRNVRPK